MTYKADFHTHSIASPDGALTHAHYRHMLESGRLDYVAITDHNTTDFAQEAHAQLGDAIIVGEEITTSEGEIIGLFLTKTVPPFLSIAETIELIHEQHGLVYIPHPFETVRKGVSVSIADAIAAQTDIIEIYNGRAAFQDRSARARTWAQAHDVPGAASSDAHGIRGWGRTYTVFDVLPTRDNLVDLLRTATYHTGFPGVAGILYPKVNRLKKWSANRHAQ